MITNRLRLHSVQLPLGIVENMEKELTSVKEARSHFSRSHPFVFESPIILAVVHARKILKKKTTYTVERHLTTTSLFRPLFLARQNCHTFFGKNEKSSHLLRRLAATFQGLNPSCLMPYNFCFSACTKTL